ncbi:MAG TPA: diguanylate cyclase, partial [Gammaproteobacteria bacterium]|nr:diguanylate cyclase [Gammaproteobacteria bacterium]
MNHISDRAPDQFESQGVDQLVRTKRADMLFASAPQTMLLLLLIGVVYVYVQRNHVDYDLLLLWFAILCASIVLRGFIVRGYLKASDAAASLSRWLWFYRGATFVSSLIVSSVNFVFWDGQLDGYQVFTLSLLIGISAGALVTINDFITLAIYVVTLLMPVAFMLLMGDGELQVGLGLLIIALILVFIKFGAAFNKTLITSLRLRYENESLLKNLEREKNRVDNRLGRILNDSSNEIYVIDAESLKFLQLNTRALNHLGYSEQELRAIRLPDILVGMGDTTAEDMLQPMYDDGKGFLFRRGRHQCKNGDTYPVEVRFQLSQQEEPPIIVATALDITERNKYEQQLRRQANIDELTGLPNRHYMMSHIDQGLVRSRRSNTLLALLFLDLDNFKSINDSLGHNAGDELLQQAANRIRSVLRASDTPARLGGDEFLVMLEGVEKPDQAGVVAEKLVKAFSELFILGSRRVHVTTSVGISVFPGDGETVEMMMQSADTAMYEAKNLGRSGYQFFSSEMRSAAEEQVIIASHLSRALENNEISVVYQPIMAFHGNTWVVAGAEALVRWKSEELGQVPPNVFIPVAENVGLIIDIGQYVLETACIEARQWPENGAGKRFISVNVSSRQFRSGDLLACVDDALEQSGLSPAVLKL